MTSLFNPADDESTPSLETALEAAFRSLDEAYAHQRLHECLLLLAQNYWDEIRQRYFLRRDYAAQIFHEWPRDVDTSPLEVFDYIIDTQAELDGGLRVLWSIEHLPEPACDPYAWDRDYAVYLNLWREAFDHSIATFRMPMPEFGYGDLHQTIDLMAPLSFKITHTRYYSGMQDAWRQSRSNRLFP